MTDLYRNKRLLWTVAIVFVIVSVSMLGVRTLVPPDEGRYAEMAREMFVSGDWVTTRLNGIKYFEKPPLQTWMTALVFSLFGTGEWQARLWTGLCGIFGVFATGYTGWRLYGARVGIDASLVLGSCLYWAACSQINSIDMGLSAMMTITLCAMLLAQHDTATVAQQRNWMLVCWAGMAFAMLSKGLIGIVLPGAVLVLYTLAARDWAIWRRLHAGKGLLLCLCIAAPWFILVGLRNPEQPHFFFVHEHFDRFLLKEHHRDAAWWIFLALLAVGSIPWAGVLVQSLLAGARRERMRFQPHLLTLIWVVLIVAFFSMSHSKLPGYILPVMPAAALLVAKFLGRAARRSMIVNAGLLAVLGLVLLTLAPFVTRLAKHQGDVALYASYLPWLLAAGMSAFLGGATAMHAANRSRHDLMMLALAFGCFTATQCLQIGFEPIGRIRAGIDLLPALQAELRPTTRLYSVGLYEQSLTFYLQRPVTLVDYRDELDFGLQQQPELAIPTIDAFVERWRADSAAGTPALAIVRNDIVQDLSRKGATLHVVASDQYRTVIVNR